VPVRRLAEEHEQSIARRNATVPQEAGPARRRVRDLAEGEVADIARSVDEA
jgi:hypothetical protein